MQLEAITRDAEQPRQQAVYININFIMMRTMILIISSTLIGLVVAAQPTEPLAIARKLFGRDSIPNIEIYITDEYKGQPCGRDIHPSAVVDFQLLQQTQTNAVVAMTITDSSGYGLNTYLHFKKDPTWKMCAFRALAMTGLIEKLKEDLEKMTPEEIAKMSKRSDQETLEPKFITSREDYDFQLGNARLILDLDENLVKYFKKNQNSFDSLKNDAIAELTLRKNSSKSRITLLEEKKKWYQKLFISSVSYGDFELGHNSLVFLIGGILDNTVGYLFVKDPKDIPAMSPDNMIMLKEIGNGWYLYKTT